MAREETPPRTRSSSRASSSAAKARDVKRREVIGWREWIALPELGVDAVKAKIDTGARTSALHAFRLTTFSRSGQLWARFEIHPRQRTSHDAIEVEAMVIDERQVRSSNGEVQSRPVIRTDIEIDGHRWPIDITLTNRDEMGFRMLIGRAALRRRFIVDPARSFTGGRREG